MKILSIDFDYFPIVDKDILYKFPDGVDQPAEISRIIWASRYASYPELKEIKMNTAEFELIKIIIMNQKSSTPCMVAQSHIHAYRFILDHIGNEKKVELVNEDFHHDLFNDSKRLDCGNWIGHLTDAMLRDNVDFKLSWVANPESLKIIGAEELRPHVKESLAEYKGTKFDAVFLCRSDNWVPPHLDRYFLELAMHCITFTTCRTMDDINNRKYEKYEAEVRARINGLKNA